MSPVAIDPTSSDGGGDAVSIIIAEDAYQYLAGQCVADRSDCSRHVR